MMKGRLRRVVLVFFGALFMVMNGAVAHAEKSTELMVSAAASLTNAFTELKGVFEKKHPGVTVRLNFAASNPLLKQMQEGAPVDVFASADEATMDKAVASQCVNPNTRKVFAANGLVLVVPLPEGKGAAQPEVLAADKLKSFLTADGVTRIAVGQPESVPVGRYTREALKSAGLWDTLQPKMIFGASVRQVLDYVARGEVDAGFVYTTDAGIAKDRVGVVLHAQGHSPVLYPLAIATQSANLEAAKAFVACVLSPEGQAVLAKYGFEKPLVRGE